jgi:hypothetical protein
MVTREPGRLKVVRPSREIRFEGDTGFYQSFWYCAPPSLTESLGQFFGVACGDSDDGWVKGRISVNCWALRCFDRMHAEIEGFERSDGERWTLSAWRRSRGEEARSPLEVERERRQGALASAEQSVRRCRALLDVVEAEYVDWDGGQ